jgi:hypothetical protein
MGYFAFTPEKSRSHAGFSIILDDQSLSRSFPDLTVSE